MSNQETEWNVAEILRHEAALRDELEGLNLDISKAQHRLGTLIERQSITLELLKAADEARTNKE